MRRLLNGPKRKLMQLSRQKKEDHFYSLFKEGMTVLDVGVASEVSDTGARSQKRLPARNHFLHEFRYKPSRYVGLGIDNLSGMESLFPGKRFVQYAGKVIPFQDKSFDWVFSNAVIEHVIGESAQLAFINEMLRVAHNVFFTTPNKYFVAESHTNVLFLHWNDQIFYNWCRQSRAGWNESNLNLLSYTKLDRLMQASNATSYEIFKNRIWSMPITLTIVCTDKSS